MVCSIILISACRKDELKLTVDTDNYTFSAEGGEKRIHVKCIDEDGCLHIVRCVSTVSWLEANESQNYIVITAEKNTTEKEREGEVVVTSDDGSKKVCINIKQEAGSQPVDYSAKVLGNWTDLNSEEGDTYCFRKNNEFLVEMYGNGCGVYASGTYKVNQDVVTVDFNYVAIDGANSFGGFTNGKACQKKYTIQSCDGNNMTMKTEDGKTLKLEKY